LLLSIPHNTLIADFKKIHYGPVYRKRIKYLIRIKF
jgi:hypothetical protein